VWGGGVGEASWGGGGGAVVKSLNKKYKSSQQLSFTMFIYLHDTKMLYLYLKCKDNPFLCDFIHNIMYISKS